MLLQLQLLISLSALQFKRNTNMCCFSKLGTVVFLFLLLDDGFARSLLHGHLKNGMICEKNYRECLASEHKGKDAAAREALCVNTVKEQYGCQRVGQTWRGKRVTPQLIKTTQTRSVTDGKAAQNTGKKPAKKCMPRKNQSTCPP